MVATMDRDGLQLCLLPIFKSMRSSLSPKPLRGEARESTQPSHTSLWLKTALNITLFLKSAYTHKNTKTSKRTGSRSGRRSRAISVQPSTPQRASSSTRRWGGKPSPVPAAAPGRQRSAGFCKGRAADLAPSSRKPLGV